MDQYQKRGSPVEVEDVPPGSAYRVNDGGIISYHTKETFALLYEKTEPAAVPITAPISTPLSDWITTAPTLTNPMMPTVSTTATTTPRKSDLGGHWDGDEWVEPSGRRVLKAWVLKYPAYFGPAAVDPDHGHGDEEITREQVLEAVKCIPFAKVFVEKFWVAGGTFSTWSEIHCFIVASSIGYTDVEHSKDVPPCPEFWLGESQYWVSGIAIGRASRKVEEAAVKIDWAAIWANKEKVGAALTAVFTTGAIAIPPLIDLLFKIKIFGG